MVATPSRRPVRAPAPPRKRAPWRDPAGRFSWLKTVALVLCVLPGALLAFWYSQGLLGPRGLNEFIRGMGHWAVRFLLLSLAVTPARVVLNWPRVVLLRRMLGVTAASYAGCHFLLYCLDQKWNLLTVAREIVLRFYLTIGFLALLGLIALAATSTDATMRRMGRNWKRLHRLIFPIAALALLHYFLQSKADASAAAFVTGLYIWELAWRSTPKPAQPRLWLLPLLAVAAVLATAAIEAAWYALAKHIEVSRVLEANLNFDIAPRPAMSVLLWTLLLAASVAVLRLAWRQRRPRTA